MDAIGQTLVTFWESTGIANFSYQNGIMIIAALFFLYLAIRHGFEPLLLVPIAFGMLLSNLPMTAIFINDVVHEGVTNSNQLTDAGIFSIFYMLKPVLPSLIFLGVGAMTDFGPLIANPKSLLMGAAAQLGIFFAFFAGLVLAALYVKTRNIVLSSVVHIINNTVGVVCMYQCGVDYQLPLVYCIAILILLPYPTYILLRKFLSF